MNFGFAPPFYVTTFWYFKKQRPLHSTLAYMSERFRELLLIFRKKFNEYVTAESQVKLTLLTFVNYLRVCCVLVSVFSKLIEHPGEFQHILYDNKFG